MAKLFMHLVKRSLDMPVANAAVVTISQVADASGRYPKNPVARAVSIPAGPMPPLVIDDLPPGRFDLVARLPSGATDRRTVELDSDGEAKIAFDGGQAEHEWLSWQTLAGSIPSMDSPKKRRLGTAPPTPSLRSAARERASEDYMAAVFANRPVPPIHPDAVNIELAKGRLTFERVDIDGPADASLDLDPSGAVSTARAWQIRSTGPYSWNDPATGYGRNFAVLRTRNLLAVALLPVPWPYRLPESIAAQVPLERQIQRPFAAVDLMFDREAEPRRATRMTLREPEFVALLGYLAAGRLPEAAAALGGPSLDAHVTRLIGDKVENPLAAVGAAYVGLATGGDAAPHEEWRPWLRNLMELFPGLPDGAVLHARDLLDRARSAADLRDALASLKEAYLRGVPYYVAGLQHLLNGLQLFCDPESPDLYDSDAKRMRDEVADVAALVDPTQTFTTLTLVDPA